MSVDISVSITEDVVDIIATPTVNIVNVTNSASIDPGLYDLSEFTNTSINPFVRTSGLSSYVPTTRTISTTAPLSGGGDLSANRTLSIATANTTTTGALSSTDWNTFNGKQNALGFTPVPTSRTLTINGTTQDLSADRTFTISTGITIGTTAITSGTVGRVLFEGTGNVVQESANLFWDNTNARLGIGGTPSAFKLDIVGTSSANIIGVKVRNTSTNGYTEINCYNNTGGDNDRIYFGVGGTATGDVYQNRGYFISSLALEGITFTAGKATTGDMRFFTGGNNERLRIFGNGNVGINTTTDAGFKLDVNGTARVSATDGATAFQITAPTRAWYFTTSSPGGTFNAISGSANGGSGTGNFGFVLGGGWAFHIGTTTSQSNSLLGVYTSGANAGDVRIGGQTSVASSLLTLDSTTKGFLLPRQTQAQRTAIASPAIGLQVYQTDGVEGLYIYKSTGWALLL
jgi:hypothetical protein